MTLDKTNQESKRAYRLAVKSRLNRVSPFRYPFLHRVLTTQKYLDKLLDAVPEARKTALAQIYDQLEEQYWQVISHFPLPTA